MHRRNNLIPQLDSFCQSYNEVIKGEVLKRSSKISQYTETDNFFVSQLYNGNMIPVFQNLNEPVFRPSTTLLFKSRKSSIPEFKNPPKLIILFELPINLCIIYSVFESLNDLSYKSIFNGKFILSEVIWVLFVADFISNFFVNKRKINEISNKQHAVAEDYIKNWALFDFISLIPFRHFGNPNTESFCKLFRIFKINRFFQMIDIKVFARVMISKIWDSHMRHPRGELMISLIWNWIVIVLNMCLLIYASACVWWYFSDLFERYEYVSVNYISYYSLYYIKIKEKIIITMYFIATSLLTVGYGDYSATNVYEMIFCSLLVTFGAAIFSYTMSIAGFYIHSLSKLLKSNKNEIGLEKLIGTIESFKGPMAISLKTSLFSFFQFYWKHDRLGQLAKTDKNSNNLKKLIKRNSNYFKKLPVELKKSILDILFNDYFRHFKYLFPDGNKFKYHICTFFLPRYFENGMFLIKEEEKSDEIFMVSSGTVQLCFDDIGGNLVECKTFTGWFVVGDFCVVLGKKSFASFKAASSVVALSIPERIFTLIIQKYSPTYLTILQNTIKRRASKLLYLMNLYGYDFYHNALSKLYKTAAKPIHSSLISKKELSLMDIYTTAKYKLERRVSSIRSKPDNSPETCT